MYGKGKEVEKLDYNPKLRTLIYRIGDCFVKHRTPKYRDIYDDEKRQQLLNAGCSHFFLNTLEKRYNDGKITAIKKNNQINELIKDKKKGVVDSVGHADMRARRKMMKEFLKDYYNKCLLLRGKKADEPYSARFHPEAKKGGEAYS